MAVSVSELFTSSGVTAGICGSLKGISKVTRKGGTFFSSAISMTCSR